MKTQSILIMALLVCLPFIIAQEKVHDKGILVKRQPGFYEKILNTLGEMIQRTLVTIFIMKIM